MIAAQIFRVMTKQPKPVQRDRPGLPLDALREAKRRIEQERDRQQLRLSEPKPLQPSEQLQQPPTVAPESSWFPSLLLLALLACLCLMVYRLWTGK